MSYLTDYEMMPDLKSSKKFLSPEKDKAIGAFIAFDVGEDGWSYLNKIWVCEGAALTWRNHRSDMSKLSVAFPDILFMLYGTGEGRFDIWKEYYINGKFQVVWGKVLYPDLDENELKEANFLCPACYGSGVEDADGLPSIGCRRCWGTGEITK